MKKKRHEMILKLIKENEVATQEELLSMLIKNGFSVTQATVSRDINELHLIKVQGKKVKSMLKTSRILTTSINSTRYFLSRLYRLRVRETSAV